VSRQLGHSGIQVTQAHCAKYIGTDGESSCTSSRRGSSSVRFRPIDLLAWLADCSADLIAAATCSRFRATSRRTKLRRTPPAWRPAMICAGR
jgi:hypothetical protein